MPACIIYLFKEINIHNDEYLQSPMFLFFVQPLLYLILCFIFIGQSRQRIRIGIVYQHLLALFHFKHNRNNQNHNSDYQCKTEDKLILIDKLIRASRTFCRNGVAYHPAVIRKRRICHIPDIVSGIQFRTTAFFFLKIICHFSGIRIILNLHFIFSKQVLSNTLQSTSGNRITGIVGYHFSLACQNHGYPFPAIDVFKQHPAQRGHIIGGSEDSDYLLLPISVLIDWNSDHHPGLAVNTAFQRITQGSITGNSLLKISSMSNIFHTALIIMGISFCINDGNTFKITIFLQCPNCSHIFFRSQFFFMGHCIRHSLKMLKLKIKYGL